MTAFILINVALATGIVAGLAQLMRKAVRWGTAA